MLKTYYYPTRTKARYFDDFITKALWDAAKPVRNIQGGPAVNIKEVEKGYEIELAAPGLRKEDFELSLDKNQLSVSIKQHNEGEGTDSPNYIKKEFGMNAFQRTFTLKENTFDTEHIEAKYNDGILVISLPKMPVKEPQKIEIS